MSTVVPYSDKLVRERTSDYNYHDATLTFIAGTKTYKASLAHVFAIIEESNLLAL